MQFWVGSVYSYKFNAELQSQRDMMSQLQEDCRKIWFDHDELQLWYDDEVYNGGAWKKEKEHLCVVFGTGIPRVGISHTVPVPVYTVPFQPQFHMKPAVSSVPTGCLHKKINITITK